MRRLVRILLVGDEGVGKSTLITTFIKEKYINNVQDVVPEVSIPPEVTPENVTTHIIDTKWDELQIINELKKAHVIALVYAIDQPQSFDRIANHWLPYFRSVGVNIPVILVGNKIDLRNDNPPDNSLEQEIVPIMQEFKEVETCVECSAKSQSNISEVFYFAQRAVLHPTAPLYDSREHVIKPSCAAALSRIFKLCDTGKDGLLDTTELNEFQRRCFGSPLQQSELEGILHLVATHSSDAVSYLSSDSPSSNSNLGLTELGFILLHTIFIQRGRLETTWTVLRKFGYAEDLRLKEEFLYPRFDVPLDCSVELSPDGYSFLTEIFEKFDRDKDGALSDIELADLFSTSPGNPWIGQGFPDTTITDEKGSVTLQGWLAQWSMMTLLDHKTSLAYLAYLGYEPLPTSSVQDSTSALKIARAKRRRKNDYNGKSSRNVFLCYVIGATGSGKTSILRSLVKKPFSSNYETTRGQLSVVNSVEMEGGAEKYLVMQEFGSSYEASTLRNSKKLDLADVIVLVYDCSDANSFTYLSNIRQQYNLDSVPCVFVATKSDLDLAQQRHEVQPDVYCRRLNLSVPVSVSVKTNQTAEIFQNICSVAVNPQQALPLTNKDNRSLIQKLSFACTVGGGLVGLTAILIKYYWKPNINLNAFWKHLQWWKK